MSRARSLLLVVACCVFAAGCGDAAMAGGGTLERTTYTLHSDLLDRDLAQVALVPDEPKGRPLLVLLHGYNARPQSWLEDPMPRTLAALGDAAPIVVSIETGDASYYHDRAAGKFGTSVLEEVIPDAVERFGADPDRIAIGGHSMGGFGALDLALQQPGRFCAVGGHEPALWRTGGETPRGAFDDAEDFAEHDVISRAGVPGAFGSTKVWIDWATADAFVPGSTAFVAAMERAGNDVTVHDEWVGVHSMRYERAHLAPIMRFYAAALADC